MSSESLSGQPTKQGPLPRCGRCLKDKAPVGRSVPLPMAGGLCDEGCKGYREDPTPGCRWPGEESCGPGCPWGIQDC